MHYLVMFATVLASACAAAPPPSSECTCAKEAVHIRPRTAAETPPAETPAATATQNYRRAERVIGPSITSPVADKEYIKGVERADKAARQALRVLVAQDGRPTAEAIANARAAIAKLHEALTIGGSD